MRKTTLVFTILIAFAVQCANAQVTQNAKDGFYRWQQSEVMGRTGYINSRDYFDAIKRWKSLEGAEWHMTISYENSNTGDMVLAGWHELPLVLGCTSKYLGSYNGAMEQAIVRFKIIISRLNEEDLFAEENRWKHKCTLSDVSVVFRTIGDIAGYESFQTLNRLKQELTVIADNGANFKIDEYFFGRMKRAEEAMNESKQISEDETLSKRKHKRAVEDYENKQIRFRVYEQIMTHINSSVAEHGGVVWLTAFEINKIGQ